MRKVSLSGYVLHFTHYGLPTSYWSLANFRPARFPPLVQV